MPEMSSAMAFVTALKTRRTNSTKALDVLFAKDPVSETHPQFVNPNFAKLQDVHALSSGLGGTLPPWAKEELLAVGLSLPEIDHVGQWPVAQRETVREALVKVIEDNKPVEFFWDLHDGAVEDTAVSGDTITFLSPRANVRVLGPDNIIVDVASRN